MTESPKPLGMSDFFALEAGEYLERLDGMLAKGDSPSADEIVRLARALRGSALMANQPAIARAAAGLEVLAREGAAIAGALERAAQALRANPRAHDPLQHVMRALQPLRGLAALTDLPPLPDLLEGIERAIGELARSGLEPPTNLGELFQVAGSAIARAAREVAERGRPDPEGPDFRQFAGLLVKFMESEPDAVSIGSLYYSDSGPHIVSRGVPAARPSTLGKLELVSHGEHLRQAADSLERAPSATQRELRAHTLGTTFRALANEGGGVLADRVAQFAIAGREAVASGIAVSSAAAFAAELRRAGDLLVRSGTGDEEALAAELDGLIAGVRALQPGAPPPVVPIESLAPAPPPRPRARGAAEEAVPESADLVGSWAVYQRLVLGGVGPASLEELIAAAAQVPTRPRAPSLDTARPPAGPRYAPPGTGAELPVVDVRLLLYRGERALQRAQELREAAKLPSGETLRALVEEVCDLVALAVEPPPTS